MPRYPWSSFAGTRLVNINCMGQNGPNFRPGESDPYDPYVLRFTKKISKECDGKEMFVASKKEGNCGADLISRHPLSGRGTKHQRCPTYSAIAFY